MAGIVSAISVGTALVGAVAQSKAAGKAADATRRASASSIEQIEKAAEEARGDINRIFPKARESAQAGFQGALDTFNRALPAQSNAFIQGNVGAQNAILAGLPQIQNALLGNNVDLSQLQAFQSQNPFGGSNFNQQQQQTQLQQPQQFQAQAQQPKVANRFIPPPSLSNALSGTQPQQGGLFATQTPFNIGEPQRAADAVNQQTRTQADMDLELDTLIGLSAPNLIESHEDKANFFRRKPFKNRDGSKIIFKRQDILKIEEENARRRQAHADKIRQLRGEGANVGTSGSFSGSGANIGISNALSGSL